jgi:cysteine desulfurase
MRRVYLDNNATTRVDPCVVAAKLPFPSGEFGNPSAAHQFGRVAESAIHAARLQVQHLLGTTGSGEIVFNASVTEADNTVLLAASATEGRDEIVMSAVEHPAVLAPCRWQVDRREIKLRVVPVDRRGGHSIGPPIARRWGHTPRWSR